MQKEVDNAEKEIQELTDTLKWKEKIFYRNWGEDEREYELDDYYWQNSKVSMEYEEDWPGIQAALENIAEIRWKIPQVEQSLTTFMKDFLLKELVRLEVEEWKLF
jgi:hypothetical protein